MSKVVYPTSIALLVLALCSYHTGVQAQIAPTNSATISGSVNDGVGKPIANAKITLSGPKSASTQTDPQGLFVFVGIPLGTYEISTAAVGLGTAVRSVSVEGDTTIAIQYEASSRSDLKTIARVSSNANAQFNVTTASITQVNPIANAFAGQTSWRTILEQIPGVAQAGLGVGGSNFAAIPDGPFVPVQISINGALPYETATLLDDMPLISNAAFSENSAGSGTNLGLYPLNGFDSADVVRGPGASAPSIVNSIGGSFVLHSPTTVWHNRYEFSVSTDPYGGVIATGLAAIRAGKLSAIVTYGVNDSPGPLSSAGISAYTLFNPVAINGSAFSCSGACTHNRLYAPNYNLSYSPYYGYDEGLLTCCFNMSTAWSQRGGSLTLGYALSPSINVGIFYAGQTSEMPATGAYYSVDFIPPAGYTGGIAGGQYSFPYENGEYLSGSVPYLQSASLLEEKINVQLGRGVLHLAALQNRTFQLQSYMSPASVNVQLYGGGSLCSNMSPNCSTGTYVSTVFNGGTYTASYPSYNLFDSIDSNNRDLLLSYQTEIGQNAHAGFSFVQSYYDMPFYEVYAYGAPYNCNATYTVPSAISQTTDELRLFMGGNPSEKTSLDLSAYFVNADYHVPNPQGFNSTTYDSTNGWTDARYTYAAPRLGFAWRPSTSVAIRAAAGGGFAEAPLSDLVGSSGTPNCTSGLYCSVSLRNLNLQPEKSFGFDIGTDIRLRYNTVVSFDVYRSNLYGQVYNSTLVTGAYLGLPLYTSQYGNLGESRYEGILIDVRHDVLHGLYWLTSAGLTRGYVVSVPAGFYNAAGTTCNLAMNVGCANQTVVPNINFDGEFGVTVPYAQGLGTIGYRWNPDKFIDLVATYYGKGNTYFRPAFVELDGHVSYSVTKNISLLATFRNITGIYDNPTQIISLADVSGVPAVSGPPFAIYGEMYGPRTALFTMNLHF